MISGLKNLTSFYLINGKQKLDHSSFEDNPALGNNSLLRRGAGKPPALVRQATAK